MSDADKATVRALFDQTANTAAADMRKRAILVLVEMKRTTDRLIKPVWDEATLAEAMDRLERLPVVEARER